MLRHNTPVALLYNSLLESILLLWTVQVYLILSLQGTEKNDSKSLKNVYHVRRQFM